MEEQTNIVQEQKKKGNGGIIALLFIIIVLLTGVIVLLVVKPDLFKTNSNGNNNETTQPVEEEKVTFSNSELEEYVNYISPISIGPSALLYDTSSVKASQLSAGKKIEYIGSLVYSKQTSSSDYKYGIISESNVKTAVEKVYGPNTYEKTTFNLGCGDYTFNESERNYYSPSGCGGTTATVAANTIIDYKATKSKLEITTAYAILGGTNKIYKDYNQTIALDDYTYSNSTLTDAEVGLKEYIKNNKDKLSKIIYTFESSDGINYYFTGFENNK